MSNKPTLTEKPLAMKVTKLKVKLDSRVICKTFPGIPKKPGESGMDYFTRATNEFCHWLETCLEVETTAEII